MFENLRNKKVLVTGGAGSVGHALAEEFKKIEGLQHFVISRNEASQFKLNQKYPNIKCFWGDVSKKQDLDKVFLEVKPDVVIHAAAVKVVPTAEKEMTKTFEINALGSYNVAMACLENDVKIAVMIGTDKQCSPVNVYGMTKHIATSIFSDLNRLNKTRFVSTRYGNVLCSRSSLGVIIMEQAQNGKNLTVTDPEMTRFFFTIQEGVRLIDLAIKEASNFVYIPGGNNYGYTVSTQMCAVKLQDLFEVVAEKFNVNVNIIGRRPGEKTHEHLMADYELKDTVLVEEYNYSPFYAPKEKLNAYITIPHLSEAMKGVEPPPCTKRVDTVFSSDVAPRLTKPQIWEILEFAYNNTFKE